jgi:hypothetical protein
VVLKLVSTHLFLLLLLLLLLLQAPGSMGAAGGGAAHAAPPAAPAGPPAHITMATADVSKVPGDQKAILASLNNLFNFCMQAANTPGAQHCVWHCDLQELGSNSSACACGVVCVAGCGG